MLSKTSTLYSRHSLHHQLIWINYLNHIIIARPQACIQANLKYMCDTNILSYCIYITVKAGCYALLFVRRILLVHSFVWVLPHILLGACAYRMYTTRMFTYSCCIQVRARKQLNRPRLSSMFLLKAMSKKANGRLCE